MNTELNFKEFKDLVREMRSQQVKYFATRSKPALFESKRLEKLVDKELGGLVPRDVKTEG